MVVDFGISDEVNYMTIREASTAWTQIQNNYQTIRGAFNWQIHADEAANWEFGTTLGPLVNP